MKCNLSFVVRVLCSVVVFVDARRHANRKRHHRRSQHNMFPDPSDRDVQHIQTSSAPVYGPTSRDFTRRHVRVVAVRHAPGMPSAAIHQTCCQHGGMCVLGTFCVCKKNYFGRHCEHKSQRRSCGGILHGEASINRCTLCLCSDGKLTCTVLTNRECGQQNKQTLNGTHLFNFNKASSEEHNDFELLTLIGNHAGNRSMYNILLLLLTLAWTVVIGWN